MNIKQLPSVEEIEASYLWGLITNNSLIDKSTITNRRNQQMKLFLELGGQKQLSLVYDCLSPEYKLDPRRQATPSSIRLIP